MNQPKFVGIVPPVATPILDDESVDLGSLERLVEFMVEAGVHGLWILGTTARFDLVTEAAQRTAAETIIEAAGGRVPLVLNVSEMGTKRVLERANRFNDLQFDAFAALPPWYQPFTGGEVLSFFQTLADELPRPLVIYNAPWVCNQLSFEHLRVLAEHPRIIGVKDVCPSLFRTQDWPSEEREAQQFSYLHGFDLVANSTALGADGFVPALGNAFPELYVALWNAMQEGEEARAFRLQTQLTRLARTTGFGPTLACLEAICRHRGLMQRMLPRPMASLDEPTARRVVDAVEAVGFLPEPTSLTDPSLA